MSLTWPGATALNENGLGSPPELYFQSRDAAMSRLPDGEGGGTRRIAPSLMPTPHTSLGSLSVSRLCLGTMQFGWTADEDASFAVLDAFVEAGGNFLDTADVYSRFVPGHRGGESEEIIGRWLKARGNRQSIVIATKVRGRMWDGPDGEGLSRAHIMRAAGDSLRRLGIETIDLYQCHWYDERTPIEETLRAFDELVRAGKVRHIGASNFPPQRLREALDVAEQHGLPKFVSLQPHYNLVHRREFEGELEGLCLERGVGVIPYSPLAAGFLTGKYRRGEKPKGARANRVREYATDAGWRVVEALQRVASAHGTPPAAVALAWQLARPSITAPIVGANSPQQLADQLPAVSLELSAEEIQELDAVSRPFA
jgi:aryl-alcohol dehydrogenase-like predicted oxidoreductase